MADTHQPLAQPPRTRRMLKLALVVGLLADNALEVPAGLASPALCFSFVHIGRPALARSVAGQLAEAQAARCLDLVDSG